MPATTENRAGYDDLLKTTTFTKPELDVLTKHFNSMAVPQNDKIDRSRFRDLLADTFDISDSLIMDRVFRCFDLDADNYLAYEEYIKGMHVFLKGKFDERMKFCFKVYDLNGDRYISKEEMYQMLKNCLVKGAEEDEDGVKDLVDLVLKKLDEDRDGRVSETDWSSAIGKETLLMEAFGQCIPLPKKVSEYLKVEDEHEKSSMSLSKAINNPLVNLKKAAPGKKAGAAGSASSKETAAA